MASDDATTYAAELAELAPKAIQAIRASALADQMTLGGVPAGGGDIGKALGRLGLRLVIAREEPATPRDFANEQSRLAEIFGSLTDIRDCPKCGDEVIRLKNSNGKPDGKPGSWYHERDDWGYRRACPERDA